MSYLTNPYRYVSAIPTCSTYPNSITTTADGTVSGAVIDTNNQIFGTGCLDFDGSNDYVNCNNLTNSIRSSTGSISMWCKLPSSTTGYATLIGDEGNGGNYSDIWMGTESGSGDFSMKLSGRHSGTRSYEAVKTGLSLDEWHNMTTVQDGTAIKFYVDNEDISFYTTTDMTLWINSDFNLTTIGAGKKGGEVYADFFGGFIQGVCYWSIAISDDVRNHIWNSGVGRPISQLCPTYNSDNIIAWYDCQSLTNSTLVNTATPTS